MTRFFGHQRLNSLFHMRNFQLQVCDGPARGGTMTRGTEDKRRRHEDDRAKRTTQIRERTIEKISKSKKKKKRKTFEEEEEENKEMETTERSIDLPGEGLFFHGDVLQQQLSSGVSGLGIGLFEGVDGLEGGQLRFQNLQHVRQGLLLVAHGERAHPAKRHGHRLGPVVFVGGNKSMALEVEVGHFPLKTHSLYFLVLVDKRRIEEKKKRKRKNEKATTEGKRTIDC